MIRWVLSIFVLCALAGCQSKPATENFSYNKQEVIDTNTQVLVQTWTDQETIGTADRIRVILAILRPADVSIELIDPFRENSQWTLISQSKSAPRYSTTDSDQSEFRSIHTFVLEPFLPGIYQIDSFEVHITHNENEPVILYTVPFEIEVKSVLASQDDHMLAPVSGYIDPERVGVLSREYGRVIVGTSVAVILFSTVIIWNLTRKSGAIQSDPSAYELLSQVSQDDSKSAQHNYQLIYDALLKLDPRLRATSEIRSMIDLCERARYSGIEMKVSDPQSMAKYTLELLGVDIGDSV